MKRFLAALLLPCTALSDPELPEQRPFSDYQKLVEQSPFTLATPAAEPEKPNPFTNFYVTGIAKVGDSDCVYVASRAEDKKFMLVTGEPGPEGFVLEKIEYADEVGRTKVHIRQNPGGETGVIEFDPAVIVASASPQQPAVSAAGTPPTVRPGFERRRIQMATPGQPDQPGRDGPIRRNPRSRIINPPPQ